MGQAKDEARIVRFAAHGVVAGAEAAAADHGDLGHHAELRHGVHHLCAGADDAAPLRILADHEAVDIVQENQRDEILIAVHDEARGLVGALGVDDAAEFDAFFAGVPGADTGDCFFWLATMPTAQPPMRAYPQSTVGRIRLVLVELAAIDDARDDLVHVVDVAGGVGGTGSSSA